MAPRLNVQMHTLMCGREAGTGVIAAHQRRHAALHLTELPSPALGDAQVRESALETIAAERDVERCGGASAGTEGADDGVLVDGPIKAEPHAERKELAVVVKIQAGERNPAGPVDQRRRARARRPSVVHLRFQTSIPSR